MSSAGKSRRELIHALNLAMRDASGSGVLYSEAVAERLGIASSDLECLDYVVRGPKTAGELARATGLTTGAITGVIDRLEKAGFVRRAHDPGDRRRVIVTTLPAVGERIVPLFKPMERAQMAAVKLLSDQQLAFLLDFYKEAHRAALLALEELKTMPRDKQRPRKTGRR